MPRFLLAALAALLSLGGVQAAAARPFTVDDLLHQASLGDVAIDPSERWVVFEARDPYDTAKRYDYDQSNSLALSRLKVFDLGRPGGARPLLAEDPGPGVAMGPFSPSGAHLAVYRLADRQWRLGVVTMATGAVRWLDITPQAGARGRALQWLSDETLLVIHQTDRRPPSGLRAGWVLADRLPRYWEAAATGVGAHTVFGSGRYASERRRAAPGQLLAVDVTDGSRRLLATGAFTDLEISPDARRVALFAAGRDLQATGDRPVRGAAGLETEATHLSLLDLKTGTIQTPCANCDMLPQLLSWSPTGRALMVLARGQDSLWTSGSLLRFDAVTGRASVIGPGLRFHADLNPVTVWTAWMGDDPVIFARPDGADTARDDWFRITPDGPVNLTRDLPAPGKFVRVADPRTFLVLADNRLWKVDAVGKPERLPGNDLALAQRPPRPWDGARLDRAPQPAFWLASRDSTARTLQRLDAKGARRLLDLPAGSGDLWAASGTAAVLHQIDPHGVERLTLWRPGAAPTALITVNAELAATDAPRVEPVHHLGPDGQALTSWLYLPPDDATGTPPPLIVRPYLGDNYATPPGDRYMESGFQQNIRMLTGHGYAVLAPSLPNPAGGMTDPARGLAERILGVMQAAADDPRLTGRFDPDRAALIGWSFGGYTVMTTITQTHRFRAAIEMNGISDLAFLWASLPGAFQVDPEAGYMSNWNTGGIEATQPKMLGPPWAEQDRYIRNSPLFAANRIETPLLLLHGGQDSLPVAQSEAMYSALFRQGKDAQLVVYWGAQHGVKSPGDVRDLYARSFRFLDEHLAVPLKAAGATPPEHPARGSASGGSRPPPSPPTGCRSPSRPR